MEMEINKEELLDKYANSAGYASYNDVPIMIKNLHPTHVGSIFQPFPVRISSREFYTQYPELFEARWGAPMPPDALADYNARRELNNKEAIERATALGMMPLP